MESGHSTAVADVYTEQKEMVSAKAIALVARSIQLAIKRLNKTDFRWGDIPSVVPKADRDKILDEAAKLYTDVRAPDMEREFVRENMVLELTADDFLDTDVSSGLWEEIDKQNPPRRPAPPSQRSRKRKRAWPRPATQAESMPSQST